jgi:hypothetical protein
MRLQTTADLEPVDLVQIIIGPYRPELQDLVKCHIRPRGLGIIENESHPDPRTDLPPALNIGVEISLGDMAQHSTDSFNLPTELNSRASNSHSFGLLT